MSTILKALRRLEQTKTLQMPRPLREQVATHPAPQRRFGWLVACGAALGGLALGAAGFIIWPQLGGDFGARPEGRAEFAGETAAAPPPASVKPPRVAAYAGDSPPPSPPPPVTPSRATRPERLSAAALASRVEVVERIAPPSPPPPDRADMASELPAPLPTAASEAPPRPAAPPDVTAARREAPPAESGSSRPPQAAPSKLVRTFVPGVLVVRTMWHPAAERRAAEIEVEGRPEPLLLHEGDVVGPLVVSEIEPSGVVFLHDEVELRRRVGIR
jgi:hypothetical protein